MKKPLFAFVVLLYSIDLIGQPEQHDLKKKYDQIPTTKWNNEFVKTLNFKFDSLIKKGVDSIMLYYHAVPSTYFALIIYKGAGQYSSIAVYQYIPSLTRLGSEILNYSALDSTNIFAFYSTFRNKEIRTFNIKVIEHNSFPVYGKFYFGKHVKIYAGFEIFVSTKADREFLKAYSKEWDRILERENKIYESKNKKHSSQ